MSKISDEFTAKVRQRLEDLGTTAFAVETLHGLPKDTVRNVLRDGPGKAGPTLSKVQQICDALDLELYIGARRETGPVEQIQCDGSQYAHIPLHNALLAAGAGIDNGGDADTVIDHLAFRLDWLKRIGVTASSARLARGSGDSMEPTIWADDLMMINTAARVPLIRRRDPKDHRPSPIYALIDNGEARVKRIERPTADAMMLISDNPDYPPELRQGNEIQAIQIIGRVVWWEHIAEAY